VKIIIDTNIVISPLINDKGKIGELLLNKPDGLQFIAPEYLLQELELHSKKILKLTGYSEEELTFVKSIITSSILFINEATIKINIWDEAYSYLFDIDEKDTPFLALTIDSDGLLWTGDKKLINGLTDKNINKTIITDKLYLKYFKS